MPVRRTQRGTRPWKYAFLVSALVTIIAAAGLLAAWLSGQVLWGVILLLPAVGYEAFRTAGESTRWASWAMLLLLIATVIFLLFDINLDLRQLLGAETTTVAGQAIPLGDVRLVMPALMGVCALILLARTRGRYTRGLALVIFVAAIVIIYLIDPTMVKSLLNQGLTRLR